MRPARERPVFLWDEPQRLYHPGRIRIVRCESEALLAELNANPSTLLLGTQESLYRKTDRCLDLVGDVLGFPDGDAWRRQRPVMRSLFRSFFAEDEDQPAWLVVVPRTAPFERRFDDVRTAPALTRIRETCSPEWVIASEFELRRAPLELPRGIILETRRLVLRYHRKHPTDRPLLVGQHRTRIVQTDGLHVSTDRLLYLAHPDADRGLIDKAYVPAMQGFYDSNHRLLTTASFTLAKMTPAGGEVTQMIVTFQPGDGGTAAFALGRRTLQMHLLQYPLYHDLLLAAVSGHAA